jgi:hypothetical protein
VSSGNVISTILQHDRKVTSYNIALLRVIGDVPLLFPGLGRSGHAVLVPLRALAEFWVAYYWPFVDPDEPAWHGPGPIRYDMISNDMALGPEITRLRPYWEQAWEGGESLPSGALRANHLV